MLNRTMFKGCRLAVVKRQAKYYLPPGLFLPLPVRVGAGVARDENTLEMGMLLSLFVYFHHFLPGFFN